MHLSNDLATKVHQRELIDPAKAEVVPGSDSNASGPRIELRSATAWRDEDFPPMPPSPVLKFNNLGLGDARLLSKDDLRIGGEEAPLERGIPPFTMIGGRTRIRVARWA